MKIPKKRAAIYPGTFDPVTNGHIDIIRRASSLFDEIIVAVVENPLKSTLFSVGERRALLKSSIERMKFYCDIRVDSFQGLLVEYAKKQRTPVLVRGLRAISDFEYEFQMALMNRHQAAGIETVFLMPDEKYVYLSSSISREIGRLHGNLRALLPPPVQTAIKKKFKNRE